MTGGFSNINCILILHLPPWRKQYISPMATPLPSSSASPGSGLISSSRVFGLISAAAALLLPAPQPRPHHSRHNKHGKGAVRGFNKSLIIVLDSGARFHVTGDTDYFTALTTAAAGAELHHTRDGMGLPVAGAGNVACEGFDILDVRHVPALTAGVTLVSVQQLTACGYLVAFGGGACFVKDPVSGSLLGRGRLNEDDGLYHLEFLRIPAADRTIE